MLKKTFATFLILSIILFSFGCSSTSSSNNNPPDATVFDNTQSGIIDLGTAASSTLFTEEPYYTETFDLDHGGFPVLSRYLDIYKNFTLNAEYNSNETRWEATVNDPFIQSNTLTFYGEYVDNIFWVHEPDASSEQGFFIYPGEASLTINIIKETPTDTNPSVRAELYKQDDYYYGFVLYDINVGIGFLTKFNFENTNPCTDFIFKFGTYGSGSTVRSLTDYKDNPLVVTEPVDLSGYNYIRDRSDSPFDWYTNTEINFALYVTGLYDGSTFTYTLERSIE